MPFGNDEATLGRALTYIPDLGDSLRDGGADLRRVPALEPLWREIDATVLAAPESALSYDAWAAFAERGEREPYETPYFARRTRLIALGLATVFGGDSHLAALERTIGAVCDEPTWALPAHVPDPATMDHRDTVDLFAAETGQTLAELGSLLRGRLSPEVAERIETEVTERVLEPMRPGTPVRWWESTPMNWAAVCGGSVLMAALHLERDPARLAPLVHRCLGALDAFLDGFGIDGCCAEGVAYWSYGFGYFTAAADLLERATAGEVRIGDDVRAVRAAAYGHRTDLGPTRSPTYSDVGPGRPSTAAPSWWARRGVPPISAARLSLPSDDPCGRWALLLRTLLWHDPLPPATAADHADVFAETGLVVVNRGPYALAVKGGHNEEPHNHLDLGHVAVWLGDVQVVADIGSGVYTAAYFGEDRYRFLQPSARAHNAPRFEREGVRYEQVPGLDARAVLEAEVDDRLRGRARLDLSGAYPAGLGAQVARTVTWTFTDDLGSVVVADVVMADVADPGIGIAATGATFAVVGFLSPLPPSRDANEFSWRLNAGDVTLTAPEQAVCTVTEEQAQDHDGRRVTWWRIESRTPAADGVPVQHWVALRPA